jgi:hypothetical protein
MKSCSSALPDRLKSSPVSDDVVGVFYLRTIDPSSGIFPSEAVSIKMICPLQGMASYGCSTRMKARMHVVRLLAPAIRARTTTRTSISALQMRREAGYAHARQALERKAWERDFDPLGGFVLDEIPSFLAG